MTFRIDIEDASGNKVGDGPITTATQVSQTISLDRIGSLVVSVPASEPKTQYATIGRYLHVYHSDLGDLGEYVIRDRRASDSPSGPVLSITCDDLLRELTWANVHFHRSYSNQAVDTVVADILAEASGWSAGSIETGIGNTTLTLEGESVFQAITELASRWDRSVRQGSTARTLDFGAFGVDSGIRLVNRQFIPPEGRDNAHLAIIDSIELVEEGGAIWNKVVPLGGGEGLNQLTLANAASVGSYTVQVGTNDDGTSYYYLQDTDSIATYGTREPPPLVFSQIRPITNSTTSITYAATALKLAAETFLTQHLAPKSTYAVRCLNLQSLPDVGDKVRMRYKGIVTARGVVFAYLDVDTDFYVTDVTRTWGSGGQYEATLNVSESAVRIASDGDVIADISRSLYALKAHVKPTISYDAVGPYTRRMDSSKSAIFTIRIGDEVLGLHYCRVWFKTFPLRTSISAAAASSATHTHSITAQGAHTHTLDINASGAHTHTVNIGTGGAHTHTVNIGTGGTHSHTITGQSTNSQGGPSYQHGHNVTLNSGTSGTAVSYYLGSFYTSGGGTVGVSLEDLSVHSHDITGIATDAGSHSHPGETALSSSHSHPGETALSNTHTHTGLTTYSETHDHTIGASGAHTHTITLTYGIYEDTVYPANVGIKVNGTDRTAVLGGPWGTAGASVEVGPLEIGAYLTPVQQNHTVELYCASSQGQVEFEAKELVTVQAIILT